MFYFNILLSYIHFMLWVDISNSEILYVTKASNVTIDCPFQSVHARVLWSGPPNLTSYSDNSKVNPALKDVGIIRGSENGNYSLIIYGFEESNAGAYQCVKSNGKNVMHAVTVKLQINLQTTLVYAKDYCYDVPCITAVSPGIKSVRIYWSGGFNEGSTKMYFIEYKQESQEKWLDPISVTDTHKTSYTAVIYNLLPNEVYDVRMYAVNNMNRSQFTNVFNVTTFDSDDSSSKMFSYSPVYITVGLGLLFTTMASVVYLWFKSDKLKRRHKHSSYNENRNSDQQEGNVAFNNIYGINENRQPTVPGAASASVVYSNFSRTEHVELLVTNHPSSRPSASHMNSLDQQSVQPKPSGLNYIEVELDPIPQDRKFHIHGEENRTEYSEIEIGVIGDPLQFSESETDDDNDIVDCVASNA